MAERQKCPECGREKAALAPLCLCGYAFVPLQPEEQSAPNQGKPASRTWLALVPGLLILTLTTAFLIPRWLEFGNVAHAIAGPRPNKGKDLLKCVDVYGITLKTSEFYIPENRLSGTWRKNAPRDLSTVVQGMASNRCGEPLKRVQIRIEVRDSEGKRGSSWVDVGNLANGQAKSFEKAWMARVSSYEVAEIR